MKLPTIDIKIVQRMSPLRQTTPLTIETKWTTLHKLVNEVSLDVLFVLVNREDSVRRSGTVHGGSYVCHTSTGVGGTTRWTWTPQTVWPKETVLFPGVPYWPPAVLNWGSKRGYVSVLRKGGNLWHPLVCMSQLCFLCNTSRILWSRFVTLQWPYGQGGPVDWSPRPLFCIKHRTKVM